MLEQEFGIKGKNLVTVMSDSVAVRMKSDSFVMARQRLEQEFSLMGKTLVTFLGNSVAVRQKTASLRPSNGWNRS